MKWEHALQTIFMLTTLVLRVIIQGTINQKKKKKQMLKE